LYIVEKTRGVNAFKYFDYYLFIIVAALTTVGLIVLRSATEGDDSYMFKQIVAGVVGLVGSFIIAAIDYKSFRLLSHFVYLGVLGLLVLVLFIGEGKEESGTQGWINLGGFNLQPSELSKLAFVLLAAFYFERLLEGEGKFNRLIILVVFALPFGLVFLQPDWGTCMVIGVIFVVMIFIAGFPYKFIFISLAAFIASTPIIWNFFMDKFQKDRILVFLNPEKDLTHKGWQVAEAKTAIGSGQMYGRGLFQGVQKAIVPANHTDFIFSVLGEELGFVGAAIVVLLFFLLIFRCIYIARTSRDYYGSFLVIGLTAMYISHIFENIGMCIGLLPVTGIPLPFLSYGGTAMITNLIAFGVIMNVSMRRQKSFFEES